MPKATLELVYLNPSYRIEEVEVGRPGGDDGPVASGALRTRWARVEERIRSEVARVQTLSGATRVPERKRAAIAELAEDAEDFLADAATRIGFVVAELGGLDDQAGSAADGLPQAPKSTGRGRKAPQELSESRQ